MSYLYLDLETTGLDKDNAIIEVAASYYKEDKLVSSFSKKCTVPKESIINLDALKVNKTKLSELDARLSEKELLHQLFDWLLNIKDSDLELTGINVQFDFNFLKNRASIYNIQVGSVIPYRLYDLGQEARLAVKLGLLNIKKSGKGNTLLDMAKALNVQVDENSLHSAESDVNLYPMVHKALYNLFKKSLCACTIPPKVSNE